MKVTSNALKGLFCNPSERYPFEFELHPIAWRGDSEEDRMCEYHDAADEYSNIVKSICPRLSKDGNKIIVEIYTNADWSAQIGVTKS